MKPNQKGSILPVVFLATISIAVSVRAQVKTEVHQQVRNAVARDETETAIRLLREMSSTQPKSFTSNNYDYLLARLMVRRGQQAEALFEQVVARSSVLAPYALLHLA